MTDEIDIPEPVREGRPSVMVVYLLLCLHGPLTAETLVETTGYNVETIYGALDDLTAADVAVETRDVTSPRIWMYDVDSGEPIAETKPPG